jgi:predicted regulator of Ras-like GTPase activity (Roadblock/LC7/MglB family)
LRGVLIASNEGLPIAHSIAGGADPARVAAMAAAAVKLGKRVSESLGLGAMIEFTVTGTEGHLQDVVKKTPPWPIRRPAG